MLLRVGVRLLLRPDDFSRRRCSLDPHGRIPDRNLRRFLPGTRRLIGSLSRDLGNLLSFRLRVRITRPRDLIAGGIRILRTLLLIRTSLSTGLAGLLLRLLPTGPTRLR